MTTELRETGISVVGDIPWGTHFCYFYETKQDLLDVLVPYFKVGLENNEFCLWIISNSELLTMQEATSALRKALPDLDRYLAERSIEVVAHDEWFLNGGTFDFHRVANRFKEKLDEALARGYVGMRVNGSPAWLYKKDGKELREFEEEVNELFPNERIIASCTYPIGESRADFLLDVTHNHQFAIARRQGNWEVVETPELKQAKAEIKRLNEELEQRVVERTQELAATNEELKKEIIRRKQVEEAEKESRQLYESLVQSIDGIVCEMDGQTFRITFVSKKAERILGYPVEQWTGEPNFWLNHLHPDDRGWAVDAKVQAVARMEDRQLEYRMIAADGRVVWFRDILTVNVAQDNSVLLRGVKMDITERKQAEDALRRSEDHLRLVIDTIPANAWSALPDGSVDFVNQRLLKDLGLSFQDLLGWSWTNTIHPEDVTGFMNKWRAALASREPMEIEARVRRASGDYRWFLIRNVPLRDDAGDIIRWYGTGVDITERRRAEEQIRAASERLRALSARLSAAREEESIRIAREIHDELGAALSSLRWDLEEVDEVVSESGDQPQLAALRKKIEAMMRLTDTTVNIVRRIASELRPTALDELGLVEAIEWQCEQFQARTGIICQCDSSLENLDLNQEQSTAVFRIFQEALTNILRHAQATRVDVQMKEEAGEFVLTISDNGRGITEDEKAGSQSLGLLGMRERAHLIGGQINISGSEGQGTVITVRIPISVPANS
ncbi:MAG TPA: MEDS domain-containing protein [Pyrinomonadaceae bacterium]|jgi:PAS domain S-box-containing protein